MSFYFEACSNRLFRMPAPHSPILRELRRVSKGPLVASFLDAASVKQKNHMRRCRKRGETSPRVMVTHAEFREEAREAGWELRQTWSLSSLFSGQCVALLLPAA